MDAVEVLQLLRSEEAAEFARSRPVAGENGRWITLPSKTPAEIADWVESRIKNETYDRPGR